MEAAITAKTEAQKNAALQKTSMEFAKGQAKTTLENRTSAEAKAVTASLKREHAEGALAQATIAKDKAVADYQASKVARRLAEADSKKNWETNQAALLLQQKTSNEAREEA